MGQFYRGKFHMAFHSGSSANLIWMQVAGWGMGMGMGCEGTYRSSRNNRSPRSTRSRPFRSSSLSPPRPNEFPDMSAHDLDLDRSFPCTEREPGEKTENSLI